MACANPLKQMSSAGAMAQLIVLTVQLWDLRSGPQNPCKELGASACAYNPSLGWLRLVVPRSLLANSSRLIEGFYFK